MYIYIGISLIVFIFVLLFADKFTTYSAMMSSFKKGGFEKLIIGLSIVAVVSISYGIYHNMTYQLPFVDIEVEGTNHTFFGNIGKN